MDIKKYWHQVRALAATFDPASARLDIEESDRFSKIHLNRSQMVVWLTSVDNESLGSVAGQVVSAHPMTAAEWIVQGSHRTAEPHEITAHQAELVERGVTIAAEKRAAAGREMDPQVGELIGAVHAALTQQKQSPSKGPKSEGS